MTMMSSRYTIDTNMPVGSCETRKKGEAGGAESDLGAASAGKRQGSGLEEGRAGSEMLAARDDGNERKAKEE
jgi:hypothetical protein